ncbi:MAG: Gfo/Idh/MocA family oxidoreductase [Planctomycetota bacterium]|jgi:predicted dehydrogenase|nr:Gfo/Idh/MocA family oxidoreductase [Planctomycetota bacterium]
MGKIGVAVVGLGFGANFVPIYQAHPASRCLAVCQRDFGRARRIADRFGVERAYSDYAELLRDGDIDAVHLNTPAGEHAGMARAAFEAGKHVACTVPMAATRDECLEIARIRDETGLVYMMMETAVFTREFLHARELFRSGELGRIQFLRGSHQQNMSMPGWPDYWYGFPPMHYATHAVAPLLCLARADCEYVHCLGSGSIRPEYAAKYGSPFAVETALLKLRESDLACEVTRSLFDTIRQYRESFDVHASGMSLEWGQLAGEGMAEFTGLEDARRIEVPDYGRLLPAEIAHFTGRGGRDAGEDQASFAQGGGHGGSYPHMVHEFVSAIRENRDSLVDVKRAANWTMVGLAAHESALGGGKRVEIPEVKVGRGAGAEWF